MPNRVAVLCFASGKCVISGAKCRAQAARVWQTIYRERRVHCMSDIRFVGNAGGQSVECQRLLTLVERRIACSPAGDILRVLNAAVRRTERAVRAAGVHTASVVFRD